MQVHTAVAPDRGLESVGKAPIRAIITRGKGRVDRELLDACPQLEVIARVGVGLDNVDVAYATEMGVRVINLPGSNAATVAEHTFGLMLSLQRRIHQAINEVKADNWAYRLAYGGDELRGKTLAILGRGNVGKSVAKLATAFQMKVLFLARPQVQSKDVKRDERGIQLLLEQADLLSLHLPLTEGTRHLLNEVTLKHCKPGALIVNTARGEIIDHAALLRALRSGAIGGYAADVMSTDQRAESGTLLQLPQVLVTPHMASLTKLTFVDMCEQSVRNLLSLLAGGRISPRYLANKI